MPAVRRRRPADVHHRTAFWSAGRQSAVFWLVAVLTVSKLGLRVLTLLFVGGPQRDYSGNPVVDLRANMGLDTDNESSAGSWAFNGRRPDISLLMFAEQYAEMCQTYFASTPLIADADADADAAPSSDSPGKGNDQFEVWTAINLRERKPTVKKSLPRCDCVPDTLRGRINVSLAVPSLGELANSLPDIRRGGHWKPSHCWARHRTAIIIPYRDRQRHLKILLNHLHPLLQRQQLYYTVFVVEQATPSVFNKAAIMNVGFREAMFADQFDCFVFHDVDMIPENDYNFYTCTPYPRHVGSHCNKFDYKVFYPELFGGVTAFTTSQFLAVNGFSNEYYGWGGEDDDMYRRILANNMTISRFPDTVATYTMIPHREDPGNPRNVERSKALEFRPDHYRTDGLNSVMYSVRRKRKVPLYSWILVDLPPESLVVSQSVRPEAELHVLWTVCLLSASFGVLR